MGINRQPAIDAFGMVRAAAARSSAT